MELNCPPQLRPDQVPALAAVAFATAGLRFDESKLDFLQNRLAQRVMHSHVREQQCFYGLIYFPTVMLIQKAGANIEVSEVDAGYFLADVMKLKL